MISYFILDAVLHDWRVWRHDNDVLGERFTSTHGSCDDCMALTEEDLEPGGLLLAMNTFEAFTKVDIFVNSSGMQLAFDDPCDAHTVPSIMVTMDETKGRLAAGDCQPTCGPVRRCDVVSVSGDMYKFHCDCTRSPCHDIGLNIVLGSLLFDNKTMEICHPLIAV